jgi:FixJ family two-component response regulator
MDAVASPAESRPIVYVVDDEPPVRNVVVRFLTSLGYETEAFGSAEEFLARPRSDRAEALVCDVHLVDGTGLELLSELHQRGDSLPTIFMTGAGSIPMSVKAMKLGAVEFLTKPIDWEALRPAVAHALERAESWKRVRDEAARIEALLGKLTPRERSVLPHVATGKPNKQIAAELDIVEQTVKVHRGRLMEKLGADSLADVVRLVDRAIALGISLESELDQPAGNDGGPSPS